MGQLLLYKQAEFHEVLVTNSNLKTPSPGFNYDMTPTHSLSCDSILRITKHLARLDTCVRGDDIIANSDSIDLYNQQELVFLSPPPCIKGYLNKLYYLICILWRCIQGHVPIFLIMEYLREK